MLGGSTTIDDSSEFALGSSDVVDASVSLEGDVERTPPRHEREPSLVHDVVTSAIDKAEESAEAWEAVDAAMERATEGISKSGSMAGSRPPTAASRGTQVHNLVEDAIHNVEQQAEQSENIHTLVDGVVQNVIDSAEKNPDDRPPSVVAHDVSTASNTQEFDESNEYSADFESADPTDPSSGDIARSLMPSSKLSSMQDMDAAADVSEMSPKAVGGATGDLFAATRKTTAEPQPEPEPEPESGPVEAKESSSMADPEYSADFEDAPAEYSDTFEDPEALSKSKLSAGGSPKPSPPRDPAPPAAKAKARRPARKYTLPPVKPSMQRSQLGKMVESEKKSGPSFGFGTATRFDFQKKTPEESLALNASLRRNRSRLGDTGPKYEVPGPGYYKAANSVGRQGYSERRSMPSGCFGRASRDAAGKAEDRQKIAPAPVAYTLPDSVGRQPHSMKETLPSISFTKSTRRVGAAALRYDETISPGPVYQAASGIGRQTLSGKYSANPIRFPKELRSTNMTKKNPDEVRWASVPGPGAYALPKSVGRQAESHRGTLPAVSFGTCYREQAAKASLGKLQAKAILGGALGPGPAARTLPSGVGRQRLSGNVTLPTIGFTKGERWRSRRSKLDVPGPGAYRV
uniref:Flagellar associated protein n=1 Tax=Micromonas pusilla TaxID=38833 RepID=A0A7S0NNW7_MICPS